MFATVNASVNALKSESFRLAETGNPHSVFEYNLAVRSANGASIGKPWYFNMGQKEINSQFSRRVGGHCGATKRTHTEHPDGWEMELFVVKRYKWNGHEFWGEGTGNQLIDEIGCWEKLATTEDADFLCPIVKYFTCKSDKVTPLADKMKERVVIISQKAVHVDDLEGACKEAARLNHRFGYYGEAYYEREEKMLKMAKRMGWRDVQYNPGNSGVIFDYAQRCYKAVFIDYAL